tara:strand:- start:16256 stop:16531 length:276 start_codon:yes stop_codon:yes gene_type:complete
MENKLSPRDEMLHIMKVIWGSRTQDMLDACRNMINTFEQKHGSDNIGLTLFEIEMTRQERLNELFKRTIPKIGDELKKTAENIVEQKKNKK